MEKNICSQSDINGLPYVKTFQVILYDQFLQIIKFMSFFYFHLNTVKKKKNTYAFFTIKISDSTSRVQPIISQIICYSKFLFIFSNIERFLEDF